MWSKLCIALIYIYFYAGSTSNIQHPTTLTNSQRLTRSCNNIVIDDKFLENMDSSKIEEMGPTMPYHTARYRAKRIVKEYFEGISFIEQAQLLNMLLMRKCLRNAMTLFDIQNFKEAKSNEIVSQNLTLVLASLAKKRSHNYMVAHKSILTGLWQKTL